MAALERPHQYQAQALPMLAAVLVLGDHLLVALTEQVEQAAAVLQVQQTQPTLEQSTRAAAVLVILTAQTTQLQTLSAAQVALVWSSLKSPMPQSQHSLALRRLPHPLVDLRFTQ